MQKRHADQHMPVARASAQILIRNADAVPAATAFAVSPSAGEPHVAALVRLVRAVARRAPLPGTAIQAGGGSLAAGIRLIETWRGPRFAALVFEAARPVSEDADGAAGLAANVPIGLALFASLTSQVGDGLRNGAETISGLCGTRVVLAAPDRDTAQWSADSLGRSEIEEVSEGFSYGANTIRRGRIGS